MSDAGVGCGPRDLVTDTGALGHGLLGIAEETRHFPALVPPCDGDDDSQLMPVMIELLPVMMS